MKYSLYTIIILYVLLTISPAAALRGKCDASAKANDGPGGFLWKESDHGGLVVLLPAELPNATRVEVFQKQKGPKKKNKKIARLRSTGRANGDREHWRDSRSIKEFPKGQVKVRALFNPSGLKLCWKVKQARRRND